ncbi:hypothetical protein OROMI_015883 [Orobanche minor]
MQILLPVSRLIAIVMIRERTDLRLGEGKTDLWKPPNWLVKTANINKSPKLRFQGSAGISESRYDEGLLGKPKNREQVQKSKVEEEKNCSDHHNTPELEMLKNA